MLTSQTEGAQAAVSQLDVGGRGQLLPELHHHAQRRVAAEQDHLQMLFWKLAMRRRSLPRGCLQHQRCNTAHSRSSSITRSRDHDHAEGLTSGLGLSWGTKATLKWVQKRVPDTQPLPSLAVSFFLTITAR
ncbi:hypothetical protein EYF80_052686 [Liparis tanakae]|uniref:Uncharacterized protein n=1 Tax=Liparis tanakae TaxID=230148 RepID=A0A4Z2F9W6_9TELE|nr:hypothetical protein EYF80_052686 [Liparis tanakae]